MSDSPIPARSPWSVDRWGRLIAGFGILLLTTLGVLHHRAWLVGTLLTSANLAFTALTNRCFFHDLLIRLGAKEREDLFLPGGAIRPELLANQDLTALRDLPSL